MSEHAQPVLVYNRVDQNRRNTFVLLMLLPLLVLPFAAGLVVYLVPWLLLMGSFGFWTLVPIEMAREHPLRVELLAAAYGTAIVSGLMLAATLAAIWFYRFAMLRITGAKLVSSGTEPELERVTENLCLGAGLPRPRIYVVESSAPNAFATGSDPAHASVGVTRGLLSLLDKRELEGVIAHELSHIGNHDTKISTTVAGIIATLRVPIGVVTGIYRALSLLPTGIAEFFLIGFFTMLAMLMTMGFASIGYVASADVPRWIVWRQVFIAVAPLYLIFGAPTIGLFIRQIISRQREFLADADAVVLTRDPEGLALALTKIDAWSGPKTFSVGLSASHFCIADPVSARTPWWEKLFPCHPSMRDRVELLSRMGSGIDESTLQAAAAAGAAAARASLESRRPAASPAGRRPRIRVRGWIPADIAGADRPNGVVVYEKPDGWSKTLCTLPVGSAVAIAGTQGNFLRVRTAGGVVGYIGQSSCGQLVTSGQN